METAKVITISDLLKLSRPLTGAASLHPTTHQTPFPSPPSTNPSTTTTTSTTNPNPSLLTPLNYPAVIVGTLTLPSHDRHNHSRSQLNVAIRRCSRTHCLSFSDDRGDEVSSCCCDILDFDLRIVGSKIRVLAWNFIPLSGGGGLLEIIRWASLHSTGLGQSSNVVSSPLMLDPSFRFRCQDGSKARYFVNGVVDSVSPISVVSCSENRVSDSLAGSHLSSGGSRNLQGFLAQVRVCKCQLCRSKSSPVGLSDVIERQNAHSFTDSLFVYFCGPASPWHPVITKFVGKFISLSDLKKKLVYIGKDVSQLMYVTTEKSFLHVPRLPCRSLPFRQTVVGENGQCSECSMYTGIVKGIHVHGMVVELDKEVWLLLTDHLLFAPHSLRVGAIISVKNVHFVDPRFSWTRIRILGSCYKTSINVDSYSPVEIGSYIVPQSQSLLEKFIGSLAFSARIWVLLVVVCLRKKFTGILSDKDILGSKHKEGLAQMYSKSHLSSAVFRSQHGVFMEFCKHEASGCFVESDCSGLKLALPISNFLRRCKAVWIKSQLQSKDSGILGYDKQCRLWSCKGSLFSQSCRKIFSSEEIGFDLIGNLKVSLFSGRLQLSDATGGIDVIIPGLPSTWSVSILYEAKDYEIVIEGMPEGAVHSEMLEYEPFSCRRIFDSLSETWDINVVVYAYFNWRYVVNRNIPMHSCKVLEDEFKELESGTFHLLFVTHKYPVLRKFFGKETMSSMFAEAILLPWHLFLAGNDSGAEPSKAWNDEIKEIMTCCTSKAHKDHFFCKRRRMDAAGGLSSCSSSIPTIPCLASVRYGIDDSICKSGILYSITSDTKDVLSADKMLLEFDSESFSKYQMLQIGNYYITDHHDDDLFCKLNSSNRVCNNKLFITSRTCLWSLSLYDDSVSSNANPLCGLMADSCLSNDEAISGGFSQIELPFHASVSENREASDICLQFINDASLLKIDLKALKQDWIKASLTQEAVSVVTLCGRFPMNSLGHVFGISNSACLLPEGNLISIQGCVVAIHSFDSSFCDVRLSHEAIREFHQSRISQQPKTYICIHILVDHHIVRISGAFSKIAYPVGLGPGVTATFHRILQSNVQDVLVLTVVSFVVINSIRKVNGPSNECSDSSFVSNLCKLTNADTVSQGLISELFQCLEGKVVQVHCRVIAVHLVVLENRRKCDDPQSNVHSSLPFNIPLAGFILDDGSGSCCCWVNAERAMTLLRLQGKISEKAPGSCYCGLKGITMEKEQISSMHLAKILKKHDWITVKNYGSVFDSSCQDLVFSVGSENAISCSDEDCLKFIILNACFTSIWDIVGSMMDSSAVSWLEKQLTEMQFPMHPTMQNFWAREVHSANPLTEARSMIQELQNSIGQDQVD